MSTEVIMPQMGESIFEGTITNGSRQSATRSRKTSRSSRSPPTRWTPRFPRPWPACSLRSAFLKAQPSRSTPSSRSSAKQACEDRCAPHRPAKSAAPQFAARRRRLPHRTAPSKSCRTTGGAGAASALRRSPAASPKSMESTSAASPAPAPKAASPKKTCCAPQLARRAQLLSKRLPHRRCRAGRRRISPRSRRSRPAHPHARHHCRAHGRERARQPARLHRLQGRHDAHRAPARAAQGSLRAAPRRQAHLHALHRRRRRCRAAPLSHRQRFA